MRALAGLEQVLVFLAPVRPEPVPGQVVDSAPLERRVARQSRTLLCGPVDPENAFASLLPDPTAGFATALLGEVTQADIKAALTSILSQPTIRQQLADALDYAANGFLPPADWPVFATYIGKQLYEAFGHPNWRRRIKPAKSGTSACAFDSYAFRYSEASSFANMRIARCIHCQKFTLNLKP